MRVSFGMEVREMNKFEEMGKANIRAYAERLKKEIINHANDIVTEIKCPDGQYRNRPLLDKATVIEIINVLENEIAE